MVFSVGGVNVVQNQRHLHNGLNVWEESNCYLDVVIELLYAYGFEPEPALAVTVSGCWEGDQWTFCKFNDEDLRLLYGLDIQELNPWDDLHDHVLTQVYQGHPVLIEVDSWYLPDTRGSTYRQSHAKTTIAVVEMHAASRRMSYLHGVGKHVLDGADYEGLWRRPVGAETAVLPPYLERVRLGSPVDSVQRLRVAAQLIRREIDRVDVRNPLNDFAVYLRELGKKADFHATMDWFHRFAFATFRQIGAGAELLQHNLRWLNTHGGFETATAAEHFRKLSDIARAEQFKLARGVSRKIIKEPSSLMADTWQQGIDALHQAF